MANNKNPLFQPFELGGQLLPNRILMSPLTRARATQPGDTPNEMNARYYAQRASVGLIISEASQISPQGKGYAFTPGIHSREQVEGWRKVTSAVHDAGGRIHLQLWHVGRISHPALQPDGGQPVAPSAIRAEGAQTYISEDFGRVDVGAPRALETDEVAGVVEQFRAGAENALLAGFDGVEIHGANSYLIEQFLRSGSNRRTDEYGGSLENRLRFPLMVVDAVVSVWGRERVGIRVSPNSNDNRIHEDDPVETYGALAAQLETRGIAYVEVVEDAFNPTKAEVRPERIIDAIRTQFSGPYVANGNYSAEEAGQRIKDGRCDLVSFGRLMISNPDLPDRFAQGAPLNAWDDSTFYGNGERGYTDYPTLQDVVR